MSAFQQVSMRRCRQDGTEKLEPGKDDDGFRVSRDALSSRRADSTRSEAAGATEPDAGLSAGTGTVRLLRAARSTQAAQGLGRAERAHDTGDRAGDDGRLVRQTRDAPAGGVWRHAGVTDCLHAEL